MFVTALCPTFRAPALLANSLACWLAQDYPLEKRCLIILDDDQTFDTQSGLGWALFSHHHRCETISRKFNIMLDAMPNDTTKSSYGYLTEGPVPDIVMVWEQDDIYLQSYVSRHAAALMTGDGEYSKPSRVLSDYPGHIVEEGAAGRFHSSIAFRRNLIYRLGGWPNTKRADFDQQLMGSLAANANGIVDPWPTGPIPFVYRWHSGAAHGQNTMRSPADETWYDRAEQSFAKVPFVGKLVPKMDEATKAVFLKLGA